MSKDNPLVSCEELAISTMLEVQAIIKILERKGLVSSDEVLEEVGKLKEEMEEKIRRIARDN
jgi:hypothetical protein